VTSNASSAPTPIDVEAITARLAALEANREAREERIKLLEEENRWLKAQLFGRSSEKTPAAEISADQRWLFNEIEALSAALPEASETITVPAHERGKRGRKKLSAQLPRVEIVHDIPEQQKVCARDGTALERIGEEVCEQLEVIPAKVRVRGCPDFCVIGPYFPREGCHGDQERDCRRAAEGR
jgi:transposase